MTAMNPIAYRPPRMTAQPSSPSAMSPGDSGVDRIAVNVLLYLSLKKKLNVLSLIAPFIAAVASNAGATNSW